MQHSAILSTFINLPFVFETLVLSISEWPPKTGFTVCLFYFQALASMSMTPQPIKNLDVIAQNPDMWKRRESFSSQTGFNPLIYGNDVDSVDVATRVAMVTYMLEMKIILELKTRG